MQRTDTKAKHWRSTNLFYMDRSGMNEMNKFYSMGMMRTHDEECEDQKSEKYCKKMKKKNKCKSKKVAKVCKKSCELCENGQGEFLRVIPSWFYNEPSSTSFGSSQTS